MSTMGAAATSAGGYLYILLYMYIMLYYTIDVYVLRMYKRKKASL